MKDLHIMQSLQPSKHMDYVPPNQTLRDVTPLLPVPIDLLQYITTTSIFHYNTQGLLLLVIESLLVTNDVGAVDGS